MRKIIVSKTDFDDYDYVVVPKGYTTVDIEGYTKYGWFNAHHINKNDVYFRLVHGEISGFTSIGMTKDMIPLEIARIKIPNSKNSRAISIIKSLRN